MCSFAKCERGLGYLHHATKMFDSIMLKRLRESTEGGSVIREIDGGNRVVVIQDSCESDKGSGIKSAAGHIKGV
jgi:hypothetical protein